ncbi:MAG TPA: adenylosuccinate lyase family protein [Jiangellaceae bacterium]|nr:adenylosuccinate lyase family protein [Jiangellaceae bacterium]
MGTRIADAPEYAHLWASDDLRAVFEHSARLQAWLDILSTLAEVQAELDIIPQAAAASIRRDARVERLDQKILIDETRRTGHSTLGLVRALQAALPDHAREWVYYGATVQDLTDSWVALTAQRVGAILRRDLGQLEHTCLELAGRHRDTVMVGRTHGQPGSPITFGYKAGSWADELRRHLDRLDDGRLRWEVGQLGGAVGTLAFFGESGLELRERFCTRLGLRTPAISWLTARDRIAEFGHVLAMVAATLGRIGTEIYTLQRPEIGELREARSAGGVGSITMPHKRNPEVSEHLVTLSRLARAQAAVLLEAMVGEHERDGRSWKTEWIALPEVCLLTGASVALGRDVLAGLEIDAAAMERNLRDTAGYTASERVLATLAPRLGKHRAQAALQEVLDQGRSDGSSLRQALAAHPELSVLGDRMLELLEQPDVGLAAAMVDEVVRHAEASRRSGRQ